MAIKVQCSCGKAFAAKDELAGKTVKCPGCQKPLKIPGGAAPAKAPEKAAAKPEVSKAAGKASDDDDDYSLSAEEPAPRPKTDLFAEVGLKAAPKGTMPCPGCSAPLQPEAVVCVKCGYNMKLGRKMKTLTTGGESHGSVGHGAVAQDLLDKAAETIEGDEEAEESKGHEGMPWWVYLIILIVLISLGAYMLNRSGGSSEESKDGKKAQLLSSSQLILPA